jgi:hypothetical protein
VCREFVNVAMPAASWRPTWPSRASVARVTLQSDTQLVLLQHGRPGGGRLQPHKVALRRAICWPTTWTARSAWCAAAWPSRRSPMMPHHRLRPAPSRARTANTARPRPRPCWTCTVMSTATATAGASSPTASRWSSNVTQPDQIKPPVRRAVEEERWTPSASSVVFKTAKWPENLKAARNGKLQAWGVASSASKPTARACWCATTARRRAGQNIARFKLKAFDEVYDQLTCCPTGPSAWRCLTRPRDGHCLRALQAARAPVWPTCWGPGHRLPAPAVLERVVAHGGRRPARPGRP